MKKKSKEQFIKESILAHGNKYDYSKVEYVNARTKVCIICPKHGEFWQIPNDHIRGIGCPKCKVDKISKIRKGTNKTFIEKARRIHGDKYDYSKVEYIDARTKVCIICLEHGEFWMSPHKHLSGEGCSKCNKYHRLEENKRKFIEKARKIHGNKYDYSKVEYKNSKTKVCIICPKHGEFWQTPNSHLNGEGCELCYRPVHNTSSFIEEAIKIHGNKYDYSKTEYIDSVTKVCIICPEHGEFWQKPTVHINQKCGCPICNESHLERETRSYLVDNKIDFKYQKMFNWLGLMRLDFYLPNYNIAIECQGIGHFEPTDFGGKGDEYARKTFNDTVKRDKLKKELCEKHNIKMVYIDYNADVIEQIKEKIC